MRKLHSGPQPRKWLPPEKGKLLRPEPRDLSALEKAVNDAAGKAGGLWISFIFFATLLTITTGTVTHKDLFLEKPLKLPGLGVDLPLISYFVFAPLFFLVFHFYLMLQLDGLASRTRAYRRQLQEQFAGDAGFAERQLLRQRLDSNIFVQFLIGTRERRTGSVGWLNRVVAWVTVVALPVLALLELQLIFLPYHHEAVTWWHRVAIVIDLLLVWKFWPRLTATSDAIRRARWMRFAVRGRKAWRWITAGVEWTRRLSQPAERKAEWQAVQSVVAAAAPTWLNLARHLASFKVHFLSGIGRAFRWLPAVVSHLAGIAVMMLSLLVACYPSESIYGWAYRAPFRHLTEVLFQQGAWFDPDTGKKWGPIVSRDWMPVFGSNRLLLTDERLGVDERLKSHNQEITEFKTEFVTGRASNLPSSLRLFNRDFTFARLERVDLRRTDFSGARMQGVDLTSANIQGARFGCDANTEFDHGRCVKLQARLQGADFTGAALQGAVLGGARLQGAVFEQAKLQGTVLWRADLRDAKLSRADLRDANLTEARLQGAVLREAQLQGANLTAARLQGAVLGQAKLQGAGFRWAWLQGANFEYAELQGADFVHAMLQGAFFWRARLQGADLRWAQLQGADLRQAQLEGADLSESNVYRSTCPQLRMPNCLGRQGEPVAATRHIRHDPTLYSANSNIDASTYEEFVALSIADTSTDTQLLVRGRLAGLKPIVRTSEQDAADRDHWMLERGRSLSRDTHAHLLAEIACDVNGKPYVARRLLERSYPDKASGLSLDVFDRLLRARPDKDSNATTTAACPGVVGFTEKDWDMVTAHRKRLESAVTIAPNP